MPEGGEWALDSGGSVPGAKVLCVALCDDPAILPCDPPTPLPGGPPLTRPDFEPKSGISSVAGNE